MQVIVLQEDAEEQQGSSLLMGRGHIMNAILLNTQYTFELLTYLVVHVLFLLMRTLCLAKTHALMDEIVPVR